MKNFIKLKNFKENIYQLKQEIASPQLFFIVINNI